MKYWLALLTLMLCGCLPESEPVVHYLPIPAEDVPTCNLPIELRQRNWLGPKGQGSCVYASLTNHARWLNLLEFGEYIAGPDITGTGRGANFGDGEYETRLMENLDKMGMKYDFTRNADPRFLDWCDMERRGAIMWWKPYHCCTFCGWVTKADGKQYAVILDNNRTEAFELTEREQFIRLWAGYGGFALCLMNDPVTTIPYPSYYLER